MPMPEAALIEIIEKTDNANPLIIVPNEVRINGIPLLVPADQSITVHEIDLSESDVVMVTLTLFARRVVMGTEPKTEVA